MDLLHAGLFPALWLAWAVYWVVQSRGNKASRRIESPASRLAHAIPLLIAALLLWRPTLPGGFLCGRILPATPATFFTGAALTAFGLALSVWARVHLGRNREREQKALAVDIADVLGNREHDGQQHAEGVNSRRIMHIVEVERMRGRAVGHRGARRGEPVLADQRGGGAAAFPFR